MFKWESNDCKNRLRHLVIREELIFGFQRALAHVKFEFNSISVSTFLGFGQLWIKFNFRSIVLTDQTNCFKKYRRGFLFSAS